MALYTVNYSCGHSDGRVQLFGKQTERYKKIEWMERGVCPECYRKQKEEERKAASAVAAEQAKSAGLPILVGSEKQVAWAETLRKNALSATWNTIREGYEPKDGEDAARFETAKKARTRLETETSAKWFIDNRGELDTYVRDCVKAAFNI